MYIDVISAVPELLTSFFGHSIVKRAQEKNLLNLTLHNLRDYTVGKYKQIDDYSYGGSAGMVLMIEPVDKCLKRLKTKRNYDAVIYLSPDGELFNQSLTNQLSLLKNLILLCGHYKGIDERIRQHLVTREISIGNYVLSGGELAAGVLVDAVTRLLPGVLGDETAALSDSFQDGLVAPPVFTRPKNYKGWKVPEVLLSGHEERIAEWRHEQSLKRTKKRRPDLLSSE